MQTLSLRLSLLTLLLLCTVAETQTMWDYKPPSPPNIAVACAMYGDKVEALYEAMDRGTPEAVALKTMRVMQQFSQAHSQEASLSTTMIIDFLPYLYSVRKFYTSPAVAGKVFELDCRQLWSR